jgi:hypothetical protein
LALETMTTRDRFGNLHAKLAEVKRDNSRHLFFLNNLHAQGAIVELIMYVEATEPTRFFLKKEKKCYFKVSK